MKYVKLGDILFPALSQILDNTKANMFESFDLDKVLDNKESNFVLIQKDKPVLCICDSIIDIEDCLSDRNNGIIFGQQKFINKIKDEDTTGMSEEFVEAIAIGEKQAIDLAGEEIPDMGALDQEIPLDSSYLLNPINSSVVVVANINSFLKDKGVECHNIIFFQELEAAMAAKDSYREWCDIVSLSITGKTTLFMLLIGYRIELPQVVCDSVFSNASLKYHILKMQNLKEDYKKKPTLAKSITILDCHGDILDAQDALKAIEDSDYATIKHGAGEALAVRFEKDQVEEVESFLAENSGNKILRSDENGIFIGPDDIDETTISDLTMLNDAVDSSLEDYTIDKVNKTEYNVLKDGEVLYVLEKKGSKWTCTCPGFKYRGTCKHLSLLTGVLPMRHPMEKIDEMMPEIKDVFEKFDKWEVVGSYRRGLKDFKDIDILVETDKESFTPILEFLEMDSDYKHTMAGPDIIRGNYKGYDFDVQRVEPGEWGSFLLYRTGSAKFNMKMRAMAKKKGWALNEHGLFDENGKLLANDTEEDIFKALGMEYYEPKDRI